MATEGPLLGIVNLTSILRAEETETVESLTREAETLKAKLAEEKAKLNDVDSKCSWCWSLDLGCCGKFCVVCKC